MPFTRTLKIIINQTKDVQDLYGKKCKIYIKSIKSTGEVLKHVMAMDGHIQFSKDVISPQISQSF